MSDTVFARPTGLNMDPSGNFGQAKFGSDKLNVMFYMKAVLDNEVSKQEGRPFFKNVIYVRIHPPGETLNIVDRPVRETDKHQYAMQWNQYTLNKTQMPEGTPLEYLFPNYPAVPATLKSMGVYTIEQLAGLGGNAIDNIGMGGQDYVNKAKKYLEQATDGAAFVRMQNDLKGKDEEITSLRRQLDLQAKAIQELQSKMASIGPIDHSQMNLQHVPGYDVQAARINAVHPTADIAKNAKKRTKPSMEEIENL